jgi:hypothetical protein
VRRRRLSTSPEAAGIQVWSKRRDTSQATVLVNRSTKARFEAIRSLFLVFTWAERDLRHTEVAVVHLDDWTVALCVLALISFCGVYRRRLAHWHAEPHVRTISPRFSLAP